MFDHFVFSGKDFAHVVVKHILREALLNRDSSFRRSNSCLSGVFGTAWIVLALLALMHDVCIGVVAVVACHLLLVGGWWRHLETVGVAFFIAFIFVALSFHLQQTDLLGHLLFRLQITR